MSATEFPDLPSRYTAQLAARGYLADGAQQAAIAALEELRQQVLARKVPGWLARRLRRLIRFSSGGDSGGGLYLWGGVGRGKTWLVDLFYESLPPGLRRRTHFHHFMRDVHDELRDVRATQDPLAVVSERIARRSRVLCLDELYVSDIADAMILHGLFAGLIAQGMTLVITSNLPPGDLYREGLQRARFLPAIDLLQWQLTVLNVDGGTDYRLRHLRQAPVYVVGDVRSTEARLTQWFERLAGGDTERETRLSIAGRRLQAQRRAGGVVWFDFETLCNTARSPNDYAELAGEFHTVLLSGLPALSETQDNAARRFIALVDEFYDQGVKLLIGASVEPAAIYRGERLRFEFQRTVSRLVEMQSEQYLARPHRR
ncbi:MAG: cell division protein ZapE [Steroidobacteraceae bacterium]